MNTDYQYDAWSDKFNLRVALQVTIQGCTQAAVWVGLQGPGTKTIETRGNIFEDQCNMTGKGLVDILPRKPFYMYIANPTARPVNLTRFMIVRYASSAAAYIIHARNKEVFMMIDIGHILRECENRSTDPTVNVFFYKPQERQK